MFLIDTCKARWDKKKNDKRARRYKQKITAKWLINLEFADCLIVDPNNKSKNYCTVCCKSLTAHKTPLKRHQESRSHVCNTTNQKNQEKVNDPKIFVEKLKRKDELVDAVKRFKLALFACISNHDIPLSAANSLLPVLKAHVPDSTIILQAQVGRTKVTGLIRNLIGLAGKMELVNLLKKTKFSIIVDESTDRTVT